MSFYTAYRRVLAGLSALVLLVLVRMVWTGTLHFGFLVWNLFLALLPLVFSHYAARAGNNFRAGLLVALWLLFFPNAAYVLTDLVHLQHRCGALYWLDLALLFAAGAYGVTLGFLSLRVLEMRFGALLPSLLRAGITFSLLLLCGYGMYLGRVERWNSWDIFARPAALLADIGHEMRHPLRCREAWLMSGLFGIFLQILYLLPARRVRLYGDRHARLIY